MKIYLQIIVVISKLNTHLLLSVLAIKDITHRITGKETHAQDVYSGYSNSGKTGHPGELVGLWLKQYGEKEFQLIFRIPETLVIDLYLQHFEQGAKNDRNFTRFEQFVNKIKNNSFILGTLNDIICKNDFVKANKTQLKDLIIFKYKNEEIKIDIKSMTPATITKYSQPRSSNVKSSFIYNYREPF